MNSRRLPGKVLAPIGGVPLLTRLIGRIRKSTHGANAVVATTKREDDDQVAQCAAAAGAPVYRGSVDDVLSRFSAVVRERSPSSVVRVTADNPLTDPALMDSIIDHQRDGNFDYVHAPTAPIGTAVDIMTADALRMCERKASTGRHREHLNAYVLEHPEKFRTGVFEPLAHQRRSDIRVTVDTPDDLEVVRRIYAYFDNEEPNSLDDIIGAADRVAGLAVQP